MTFFSRIQSCKLIPVVQVTNAGGIVRTAQALLQGGVPVMEITLRTESALQAIKSVAGDVSLKNQEFMVGAGTVLNAQQAAAAIDAGAKFIVSPGLDDAVVHLGRQRKIPVLPGAATATELQHATNKNVDCVKFFPAEAAGGVAMLKALAGPFHKMKFVPTGGINLQLLGSYLQLPQVLAVGGSWLVKPGYLEVDQLADVDFDQIVVDCQQAMNVVKSSG